MRRNDDMRYRRPPRRIRQSDNWVWFEDKHALHFARELSAQARRPRLTATIKDRFSRTAGTSYLSNGCQHCDAIQGDWPLGHAISDHVLGAPLGELEVLATVTITQAASDDLLASQGMRRYGHPMTWEDMD